MSIFKLVNKQVKGMLTTSNNFKLLLLAGLLIGFLQFRE